jgi:tRNA modification GTPase
MQLRDTIVALATPPGRSGIGVVRVSGPNAFSVVRSVLGLAPDEALTGWRVRMATLRDDDGQTVDQVLVTAFAAPRSYTAEDMAEISCHGASVVLAFCIDQLLRAGCRLAEPGEFTMRAFANGRIDLPRAEAVRDLIEATTLYQAKVACQQADGALSRWVLPVKDHLLGLIAQLEAGIDFAEDATSEIDIPGNPEILPVLTDTEAALRRLSSSFDFGRFVHDGVQLAIAGRPNVGKSSLFNALLARERAIVTEIPGTTRDVVSEQAAIGGIPVRLMDTAGIREAGDHLESLGIQRSYAAIADADLTLLVLDSSGELHPDDAELLERVQRSGRFLVAGNKCDLPLRLQAPVEWHPVSALSGQGIEELRAAIVRMLSPQDDVPASDSLVTNLRHASLLRAAADSLARGAQAQQQGLPHEMLLLDLYAALRSLDELSGATTADDILHRIFNSFCIGK